MTTIETLLRERKDLSNFITHFTRVVNGRTARDNLLSILTEGCLRAGSEQGMASGQGFPGQRVVCFTEAPMEVAWTMVQNTRGRRIQLQPYGVVFNKRWARSQGANPVWYIDATPSGHDWLTNHVNAMINGALAGEKTATGILRLAPFFEPMGDWRALGGTQREFSWEREWRKVGDLPFTLNDLVGVLAPAGEHTQIRAAIAHLGGANEVRFYEPNQSLGEQR